MEDTLQQNNNQEPNNQPAAEPAPTDGMADRTKQQFKKLTTSNQTLNQENETLRQQLEALKTPAPAPLPQPTIQDSLTQAQQGGIDPASYVEVDKTTGERFVNENKLEKVLAEIKTRTTQAEEKFQNYIKTNEERLQQQQREAAFRAYPELEPGSTTFDKNLYRRVKETIYGSMLDPKEYGKVLSIKEAADYVKGEVVKPQDPQVPELDKTQTAEAKVDAGAQVPAQSQSAQRPASSEDLAVLRMATRKGNVEALAHRLLATDHVLEPKN